MHTFIGRDKTIENSLLSGYGYSYPMSLNIKTLENLGIWHA